MQQRTVVVYEVGQIPEVLSYLKRENIPFDTCTIIPLEFEVEHALRERGIPYESFLRYVPLTEEFADVLAWARSAARHFHEHPAMRWYTYHGINLGEVFEPMLDMYLEFLGRYTAIFARIAEARDITELLIPYTGRPLLSSGAVLTPFEFLSPVQAAQSVGRLKGFVVRTIGATPQLAPLSGERRTTSRLAALGLALYNRGIDLVAPARPLKVYASEYWSHIDSFIEHMDDVELVMMERSEVRHIPWRQLLQHRIRFVHPSDAVDAGARRDISQAVGAFIAQWHAAKDDVREVFGPVSGIDIWPEVERALTYLIKTQTVRALTDIEGLRRILEKERPDKVLLRASIGGTAHHFFIATQVAHQLRIPSIELQHAGAVVDPRSVHSRLTASYLAGYGPLMREIYHQNHGYAKERIRPIGSPRFDHYVHERDSLAKNRAECLTGLGLDPGRPTVFVAVPFPGPYPLLFNSYQVADFFKVLRAEQKKMPELQYIFKFRPDGSSSRYEYYIRELFSDGGTVVTSTKDFLPLIISSDIACTGRSTLMFEIMLGERPMILFPWQRWDTPEIYRHMGPIAFNEKELSALLRRFLDADEAGQAVKRQNLFLSENYSFDGHAPERMAALLREKLLPLP